MPAAKTIEFILKGDFEKRKSSKDRVFVKPNPSKEHLNKYVPLLGPKFAHPNFSLPWASKHLSSRPPHLAH